MSPQRLVSSAGLEELEVDRWQSNTQLCDMEAVCHNWNNLAPGTEASRLGDPEMMRQEASLVWGTTQGTSGDVTPASVLDFRTYISWQWQYAIADAELDKVGILNILYSQPFCIRESLYNPESIGC